MLCIAPEPKGHCLFESMYPKYCYRDHRRLYTCTLTVVTTSRVSFCSYAYNDAIVIESLIFLLLSSFCPENSTLVQVFNEIGLIFTSLSTTPLKWDLEPITVSPTRIPFPMLGHISCKGAFKEAGSTLI